ncbi:CMRF35-like molecule 5 [Talpa occidentalis]|uniref:CMRF35-like molecule 5 n=1 Tax=Talpa occidentalis TaxID=50954 RepID=UPI00188EB4BE|nr:CMRF35-like molecule 5 [Talpa occidentalis]
MDVCFPGSSDITGPGAVKGWERSSLTVQCRYAGYWKNYVKYWCRGAHLGSCNTLVQTTGLELEVKQGRVSIRDHQRNYTFIVTMEALTLGDADTYWCGIEKAGYDLRDEVKVTVDPATTVSTTTTTTTTTMTTSSMTTTTPTTTTHHTAPVSPEEDKVPPTETTSSSLLGSVHFLLLVFLKVPLLLGMLSAVLWVHRPQGGHRSALARDALDRRRLSGRGDDFHPRLRHRNLLMLLAGDSLDCGEPPAAGDGPGLFLL